ncbi:hypothetical protein NI454_09085 [Brevundimonas diminuta]|uniref:hypothetical protein n=1 Tax=Brevundimonas diminuta TaxID=293 RepID=UPI0020969CED|nr:hypothetical protein [Brevundimonas diminuta]MCO8030104.1 hypothetical protein [Brevundimonas diminuta]
MTPSFFTYAPDPEAVPPVEYHQLGEPALPVVVWMRPRRRHGRALLLTRAAIAAVVLAFAVVQIMAAAS